MDNTTITSHLLASEEWTSPKVATAIAAIEPGTLEATAEAVLQTLNEHGYDSVDRELAFSYMEARDGHGYEALYAYWLAR